MILVLDNYDSFTFNLVQLLAELDAKVIVRRNDVTDVAGIAAMAPEGLVLSPGPGRPDGAGITLACIAHFEKTLPMLGVCLGHQALGQAFGAEVVHAKQLMHGRTSLVRHVGTGLFDRIPNPFVATRYHSLTLRRDSIPDDFSVTAWSDDDEVMAIAHKRYPLAGVQFHPESFLTEHGRTLLRTFLAQLPDRGTRETTVPGVIAKASLRAGEEARMVPR